jgi:beta-lactam-binding protein with PASTA domain
MTEVATGALVDARYRIVRRIGSGGMADVFCAEDAHLGREVALKVLHRRFAQDQEFVERFRREAKSAAGLAHPNVVGVFDRGEHEGTYYIAMEYLTGRTLKDIVASEAPLSQQRTIDLGVQILHAAGFAHRHGVIHRDFKPHNVIVDEHDHAKVTDFGIARAGASEMTETGSIMGTAHYLSPEQAQGHAVTASSDLYSIGVMLYEMLAGRLPFEGESAVAIALKHLSEQPPPISGQRPDVHPALEAVVMAALAKDPARRWQTAEDFAEGLEAARSQVEAGANGGQSTAAFAPIPLPAPETAEAGDGGPPPLAPVTRPEKERKRRWPWFTLGLLTLALLGLLAWALASGQLATEKREVPRVTQLQLVEARAQLERAGFEVEETRVRSAQPFDQVLDQDPNPGEEAEVGSVVTLEVSDGPGDVLVPAVAGLPEAQAIGELEDAGLKVTRDLEFSDEVREGLAIRTVPGEAEEVTIGTRVRLLVSRGPELATVPGVIGLSRASADSRLRSEGLGVAIQEAESDEPAGEVIGQDPGGGSRVGRGTTVTITVSIGRPLATVPNVVGLGLSDAATQIGNAGLVPVQRERTVTNPDEDGVVVDQRPGAGTELDEGAEVVIVIGVLEPTDTLEDTQPQEPQPEQPEESLEQQEPQQP